MTSESHCERLSGAGGIESLKKTGTADRGLGRVSEQILTENELPILDNPGKVSHQQAVTHAENQYLVFENKRRELAEADAEASYLDDLRGSVKLVAARRKKK